MKVIKLSQKADREAWLELRLGKITGTKAKGVKPLTRGKDRTPVGFWELLAEKVAIVPDGEPDIDRGQRLEIEALNIFAKRYKLKVDTDVGLWVSDDCEDIAVSPDGAEKADNPTWCVEAKCLKTKNHLKYIFKKEIPAEFREQIIQYFVVNENLKTLYLVFYDDLVALDKYVFHVKEVQREELADEIAEQKATQLMIVKEINDLIKEMKK